MKHKIILSIALVLSIGLISLTISDSTAQAQRNRTYSYDSGIILLGANQKLVVTVNASTASEFVYDEIHYAVTPCPAGAICKHSVVSQNQSDPINLAIGEGASDVVAFLAGVSGTRITVTSKNPNLTVTSQVKDIVSDAIVSQSYSFGQPNM